MKTPKASAALPCLTLALVTALSLLVGDALAIMPGQWEHTTEADFEPGTVENVVITNLGDIKLAARTETLGEMPEQTDVIYDMARIGDATFLAAGPRGKILRLVDDRIDVVAVLDQEQVFSLDVWQGQLLCAISSNDQTRLALLAPDSPAIEIEAADEADAKGESADDEADTGTKSPGTDTVQDAGDTDAPQVDTDTAAEPDAESGDDAEIADDAQDSDAAAGDAKADDADTPEPLTTLVELADVRYVWDMLVRGEKIVLATGTEGQVLSVEPATFDAEADENPGLEVLLDGEQVNVLCLASDGSNVIFAGTDTQGLIYRITLTDDGPSVYVVFDAPEPEIGALLVDDQGELYAGTAGADQARPGRLDEAANDQIGRPDASGDEATGDGGGDMPNMPPSPEPVDQGDDAQTAPADATAVDATGDDQATASSDDDATSPDASADDTQTAAEADATADDTASDDEVFDPRTMPEPTAEQRDRLRELIRERLESARDSGELQTARPSPRRTARRPSRSGARPTPSGNQQKKEGNAVYHIDGQGFAREVFRETVMVLKLVKDGDHLLIATGNEGQLYRVDPSAQETALLIDIESEQIPALDRLPDGRLLIGSANPAMVTALSAGPAMRGTYESPILDAPQISLWGVLNITGTLPDNTSLTVETRSGNVSDPEHAPWSEWSEAQVVMADADRLQWQPVPMQVQSPPARYLQYRLTLIGNGDQTPTVDRVALAYVTPNLAPSVQAIRVEVPQFDPQKENQGPATMFKVNWEARDDNGDPLVYALNYESAGSDKKVLIADKIVQNGYEWQTRQVPDGRYVLHVTADDRPANTPDMARQASRRSDPVVVDNTPPTFGELKVTEAENADESAENGEKTRAATISGVASDALHAIYDLAYVVDSGDEYSPILPEDLIFDSTRERWSITISDLSLSEHVVTLRVRDQRGNTRFQTVVVPAVKAD